MEIETFLAGNVSLGIASVVFMLIVSWVNRPFLRDVWNDPDRLWRVIARLRLVRGDMSDSGFLTLVRDVVRTKVSFAERDAKEDLSVVRIRPRAD